MKRIGIVRFTVVLSVMSYAQGNWSSYSFTDSVWYKYESSIVYLRKAWVIQWYPDGTFGVDRQITRAEMMKIVLEWNGWSSDGQWQILWNCFEDVSDEWYAPYICYATQQKMVKGIGNNKFWPNDMVTVAQGLKIALNAFDGYGVVEGSGEGWYQPFLERAHDNNILSKYAVYPDQPMTRGEMAYLVHQLMLEKSDIRIFSNKRSIWTIWCGKMKPGSAPTEFMVNGVARHTITDISARYDPSRPTKLIVAWHGRTNSNAQLREYLHLDRVAGDNAIVVYPLGLPEWWPTRNWQNGWDKAAYLRDYTFFDTIVQELSQNYCINQDEIYVMWYSLGAWFANSLACARGDVIRGLGSVWGSISRSVCSGPVEVMMMHHPDDNLASYAGGEAVRDWFLQSNRCDTTSAIPVVWASAKSNCVQYMCLNDAPVARCPHMESDTWWYYYPHSRPSFATKMIWDFWSKW